MTVCEGYILPLTKSMPFKISEKVKASRKSHTVLSCLTSAGSFAAPDFVGTIPPRFPIDSEEGQDDCFRRSLPSGHQRISMLRITLVHFEL